MPASVRCSAGPGAAQLPAKRCSSADRTPALHDNNLAHLDAEYADVIDLREALDRL
jgi:hypothetical protein